MAEEKAAEGNTTYFSEFSSDELDAKLKRKDEDGRTLLHIAAAAGTRPAPTRPAQISSRPTVVGVPNPEPPSFRLTIPPTHPSRFAGRTELVELFLANPTGRAAVNKADEVRHLARQCTGETNLMRDPLPKLSQRRRRRRRTSQ